MKTLSWNRKQSRILKLLFLKFLELKEAWVEFFENKNKTENKSMASAELNAFADFWFL